MRRKYKDAIIKEIWRVLKPNGRTLHIVETDSDNIWFKLAHKCPELFQKYFVEKIGGHVGLEMPEACLSRWQRNGFEVKKAEKFGEQFGRFRTTRVCLIMNTKKI